MIGSKFTLTFHTAGSLAANHVYCWTAQADCQLIHVSAVGGNANNGILTIGPTGDDDSYLDDFDIGDSYTPTEAVQANFVGGQFPHIPKGTVVKASLDYDGAGGTAATNFTLVLTFTEG
jgi:hypothetical protein